MRRTLPAIALFLLICGCAARVPVCEISGTVTRGGEKLTWPDGGSLLVIFLPVDPIKTERYTARDTDTGSSTYKLSGVPAGKYLVAVQQFNPRFMDSLGGRYDPGHTDYEVDVTADSQILNIDLPTNPTPGRK
ncbi:MAG: hypothetical protein U0804_14805 [Gemmataceae bacterium]